MQTKHEENPWDKAVSNRKIILFNGPPRCGKSMGADRVCSFIRKNAPDMQPRVLEFTEPLKRAAHALYCAFHGWDFYDTRDGASQKSLASGDFLGLSPREAYIAISEEYLKVKHGEDALGFLMKKRICREKWSRAIIVPSFGFAYELKPLIDLVGQRNILIIEVHAANKTFEGDSRRYVGDEVQERWPHISVVKLPNVFGNQEDKDFFKMLCEGATKKFMKIIEKEEA